MIRRFWSVLGVLCFVVVGLVAVPPSSAATSPTPPWPAKVTTTWDAVVTANPVAGGAYVASCDNGINKDQLTRLDANGGQLPLLSSSSVMGAPCTPDLLLDDGTMLINRYPTASSSELSAWKNGRQLWALNTTGTTNCSISGSASYGTAPSGIAESPDGKTLYTIFTGGVMGSACVDRVVGITRATGAIVLTYPLSAGPQPTTLATPKVWTYASRLVVLDRTQTVRELSYAGVENTSAAYQFPDAWVTPAAHSVADSFGTVFVTGNHANAWYDNKLRWRTAAGATGTVSYSLAYAPARIVSDGAGSVYFLDDQAQKVKTLNLVTETLDEHTLALHSGGFPVAYTQDSAGNGLVVQTYMDSGTGERVTDISVIDGSTNTAISQADFRQDTNDTSLPNTYEYSTSNLATMVAGGFLYYPFCQTVNSACYNASGVELVVQQIGLGGFGTPLRSDNTRTAVEDDRLEYVALGDSFSSGEGVAPFLPGTDRDDNIATSGVDEENRCHRSEYAYPMLLEEDDDLSLNLTAFVACSGATTDTLKNGGVGSGSWGEGSQLDALGADTDVVTLTIGGNDMGFKQVLETCVRRVFQSTGGWGCKYDSYLSNALVDRLDALEGTAATTHFEPGGKEIHSIASVIERVSEESPDAKILIAGYPKLFGSAVGDFDENAAAPGGASCAVAVGANISYEDAQWLNAWADELNDAIEAAAATAANQDIEVEYVIPALFNGHGLCDSGDEFIIQAYVDSETGEVSSSSFHPNQEGIATGYGLMLESLLD